MHVAVGIVGLASFAFGLGVIVCTLWSGIARIVGSLSYRALSPLFARSGGEQIAVYVLIPAFSAVGGGFAAVGADSMINNSWASTENLRGRWLFAVGIVSIVIVGMGTLWALARRPQSIPLLASQALASGHEIPGVLARIDDAVANTRAKADGSFLGRWFPYVALTTLIDLSFCAASLIGDYPRFTRGERFSAMIFAIATIGLYLAERGARRLEAKVKVAALSRLSEILTEEDEFRQEREQQRDTVMQKLDALADRLDELGPGHRTSTTRRRWWQRSGAGAHG